MMRRHFLILGLGAMLAGCTMMPKYEQPKAPVSGAWPNTAGQPATGVAAADIDWQNFFDDPRLQKLIGIALTNNRDLRVAALRVEQSRAQYRIRRSELFPTLDGGAFYTRQKIPSTASITGQDITSSTYDVNVGAAFEVDLFGRVRSLKKEALEKYFATDEARKSVQISLVSEVATEYLTMLQLQDSLVLAEQTLKAVQGSYDLNKSRFEIGAASELDLQTAAGQVETARVNVFNFKQFLAQSENALVLLIGEPMPGDLPSGHSLDDQHLIKDIPVGIPSEVLQRRPDILQAEHTLKAANANIGAARAAFFPRILLTGSAGTASVKLTDLFTGPSAAWNFSPQMTVPIFNAGRNRAELDVSKVGKQIEVATYEKTIQTAFREVADALAVRSVVDDKLKAQELLVNSQQKRYDLTNARYQQGADSYVDVLLAQQDLYAAQQGYLQIKVSRLINLVTLYRTLGGGWKA